MGFQTRGTTSQPGRNVRFPMLLALIGGLTGLAMLGYYGFMALGNVGQPTPEQVVQEFRDEGLEVGKSYPIEQDPGFEESLTPKVHEEGVRFLIPSVCPEDCGGRVFSFEAEEDLETMEGYFDSLDNVEIFGSNLGGYTYRNGLLLLQVGGDAKKSKADEYGEVFQDM
jgi:hypothetical protein